MLEALWCGVVVLETQCCYGGVVVFFRVVFCYVILLNMQYCFGLVVL